MNSADFDFFATLLEQRAGLKFTRDKAYIVESRLQPVARKWNCPAIDDLARAARQQDEPMLLDIVEALLPIETSFLFGTSLLQDLQATVLPRLVTARADTKTLRIWSAGCSTGQEAYSLALLFEAPEWRGWTIDLIATDLSHSAIARAATGIYTHFEVQNGLPAHLLVAHFERISRPDGVHWQAAESLRQRVRFGSVNLLHELAPQLAMLPLAAEGPFDLILCHNVLVSFDAATQARITAALATLVAPAGQLLGCQQEHRQNQ